MDYLNVDKLNSLLSIILKDYPLKHDLKLIPIENKDLYSLLIMFDDGKGMTIVIEKNITQKDAVSYIKDKVDKELCNHRIPIRGDTYMEIINLANKFSQ